jgi:hypothetical protein
MQRFPAKRPSLQALKRRVIAGVLKFVTQSYYSGCCKIANWMTTLERLQISALRGKSLDALCGIPRTLESPSNRRGGIRARATVSACLST